MELFDEATLRKLEQLSLVAERVRAGVLKGDRRSRRRGSSIEFADYRSYSPGDDLRRLDWNVYARLDRAFLKLLEDEEDLAVHLLIDASLSMDWPLESPEVNKLTYALRLAAALGYIALTAGDQLYLVLLNSNGNLSWGPYRGHINSVRLLKFLETGTAGGQTYLDVTLGDYALRARRPGLLLLISDLLSPTGYRKGLHSLQARGYEVGLIHLLSPDELNPAIGGDVKLVDVETKAEAEITLDASTIDRYQRRIEQWQAEIAAFCGSRKLHYLPVTTSQPWDKMVMQTMRSKALVK